MEKATKKEFLVLAETHRKGGPGHPFQGCYFIGVAIPWNELQTESRQSGCAIHSYSVPLAGRRVTICLATPASIGGQPVLFPSYFG